MPVPGTLKKTAINEQEFVKLLQDKFSIDPLVTRTYLRLVNMGRSVSRTLQRCWTSQ